MRFGAVFAVCLYCLGAAATEASEEQAAATRALFNLAQIRLEDVPSCRRVGLSAADKSIGDFLGSILAQFAGFKPNNPILNVRKLGFEKDGYLPFEVTFYKNDGEEEWSWGVAFDLHPESGIVAPGSLRCVVAG